MHTIRLAWLTALPLTVHSPQTVALRDELGDQALRTALHIQQGHPLVPSHAQPWRQLSIFTHHRVAVVPPGGRR
jgi:hypothetical protein